MVFDYDRINEKIFSNQDCDEIISIIEKNPNNQGFGIRYILRDNLELEQLITSHFKFRELLSINFRNPVIIKSIYFDKPERTNWTVNWHQDITLNLSEKSEQVEFKNWRFLSDRVVVQPSINYLNSILTYRIHLDDTSEKNGALQVIPKSETEGVVRISQDYLKRQVDNVEICSIKKGGVMIMSPLTIHSSRRSQINKSRRRVIHLEIMESDIASTLPFIEDFNFARN